jgi:hypothetical protein
MNDATMKELKSVADQAVRPLRATLTRKQRMREELLGHLVSIYEDEHKRPGGTNTALQRAKERFGDPRELTGQLQRVVPAWDRYWSILESMGCQPGESARHLAVKHFLLILLLYVFWMPAWVLALELSLLAHGNYRGGDVGPLVAGPLDSRRFYALAVIGSVPMVALFNVLISVVLAPLMTKINAALASTPRGRLLLAVLCVVLVPCCAILPPYVFGAAVVFALASREAVKRCRYQEGWA